MINDEPLSVWLAKRILKKKGDRRMTTYSKIYDDSPNQNRIIEERDDYIESLKEDLDKDDDYITVTQP